MIKSSQLKELIIKPTLSAIRLYSESAVELLMFTCAVESKGGSYIKQLKGPAMGIYQMEPRTHNDIWQNYLRNRTDVLYIIQSNINVARMPEPDRMIYDLQYATAMARVHYFRAKGALPDPKDIEGIWAYYKEHYNTNLGKSTKDKSMKMYSEFVAQ